MAARSASALAILLCAAVVAAGCAGDSSLTGPPRATIIDPPDGATLTDPRVTVRVAIEGVPLDQAHWHLYIDGEVQGMVSQMDETTVELLPGEHELWVTMASDDHRDHDDGASAPVRITVAP